MEVLMSEFIDRTSYEPSEEEYRLIEDSYYLYGGDKDEFCKQWLRDLNDGHWSREVFLRLRIAEKEAEIEKMKATIDSDLKNYYDMRDMCTELMNTIGRVLSGGLRRY